VPSKKKHCRPAIDHLRTTMAAIAHVVRQSPLFFGAALLVMAALLYYRHLVGSGADVSEKMEWPSVVACTSQAFDHRRSIHLTGVTRSDMRVDLKVEADAVIQQIFVKKGQRVAQGDPIIMLDDRGYSSALEEAQSRLRRATIAYDAELKLLSRKLSSSSRVSTALSDLNQAKSNLAKAEHAFDSRTLKAPFAAVVEAIPVEVGDQLSGTGQATAATLLSVGSVKIEAYAAPALMKEIAVGQKAVVSYQGIKQSAQVESVARSSDPATGAFRVELMLTSQEDHSWLDGVLVDVAIEVDQVVAHRVPFSSTLLDDKGNLGLMIVVPRTDSEAQAAATNRENSEDSGDEASVVSSAGISKDLGYLSKFVPLRLLDEASEGAVVSGPMPAESKVVVMGHHFLRDGTPVVLGEMVPCTR
jgi:RND family efflux transporter MFP subunit